MTKFARDILTLVALLEFEGNYLFIFSPIETHPAAIELKNSIRVKAKICGAYFQAKVRLIMKLGFKVKFLKSLKDWVLKRNQFECFVPF